MGLERTSDLVKQIPNLKKVPKAHFYYINQWIGVLELTILDSTVSQLFKKKKKSFFLKLGLRSVMENDLIYQ